MCLPQEQRIKELEASLNKCQNVQQVKGYNHSSEGIITSVFLQLKQTFSEKLQEGDYDDIADDPSLPAPSEEGRVTALVGEAGRSPGEVNMSTEHSHRMNSRLPEKISAFSPLTGRPDQENVDTCGFQSVPGISALSGSNELDRGQAEAAPR